MERRVNTWAEFPFILDWSCLSLGSEIRKSTVDRLIIDFVKNKYLEKHRNWQLHKQHYNQLVLNKQAILWLNNQDNGIYYHE